MLSIIKHGICQIFYTRKIPKFLILPEKKIFGKKLRMEDVLLNHFFDQIISFCAIILLNTNSLQLFCEKPRLN